MSQSAKIALVTGGSRGLGKNMALRIAEKGLDVIITYHSQKDDALQTVAAIEKLGRKALALQLNTGDVKSFDTFFGELEKALPQTFGAAQIDYLVNNAGIGVHAAFDATREEDFDTLFNIHFKGVYFFTQKALRLLADGGGIINVSTGLARFAIPGYSAYAAMKGAMEVVTRYQANELGKRGIRSNIVAPGVIATDFGGGTVRDNADVNAHIAATIALGRVGLPEDIGGVVAFLCTDDARWITAQRIEISGGQNL
ncbi:SDR family NAD(P)-dependent oxidoreductase [Chitinophaga sp. GCM10012297]|uniref:SDR family oxidoreductase n=1 Tax=Chitinophaga chungangae TaxID=2821488 RepID=A0ABS3YA38_9BACT|nr:SDR family oxidoreductase [Chitinophaga chungangae]MBO9151542.1 SDR family oxidoreductase [Chitinophaga chungangae]